ncbi:MAG: GNAT family N-acetyltransferase [Chloroflexota bacterium]
MILFTTDRLKVRQIDENDVDNLFKVYSNRDVVTYVDDGEPIPYADCIRWVEITKKNYQTYGYGMSAIESKSDGGLMGFVGLVHPGGQPETEIKYAFLPPFWGKGYATEVVRGMLAYGRSEFDINYVIATISPANAASRRVLEKSGMSFFKLVDNEDGSQTEVLAWQPNPA